MTVVRQLAAGALAALGAALNGISSKVVVGCFYGAALQRSSACQRSIVRIVTIGLKMCCQHMHKRTSVFLKHINLMDYMGRI
jgi:hypothetical protein